MPKNVIIFAQEMAKTPGLKRDLYNIYLGLQIFRHFRLILKEHGQNARAILGKNCEISKFERLGSSGSRTSIFIKF